MKCVYAIEYGKKKGRDVSPDIPGCSKKESYKKIMVYFQDQSPLVFNYLPVLHLP